MALISPAIPTIGQPNSTEDQDVANALTAIVAAINGGLDTANLSASAGITVAQLTTAIQAAAGLNGASTRRGKSIVATEESRTNTAYGLMTTPDRVSNIVMPTDGLIFVGYQAMWKQSVADAGRAAIFVGANQLKAPIFSAGAPSVAPCEAKLDTDSAYALLASQPLGLASTQDIGSGHIEYTGHVTTGQVLGGGLTNEGFPGTASSTSAIGGGACAIFAAAGTYDISVQFKASSGSVTVKERKLWCYSMGFD